MTSEEWPRPRGRLTGFGRVAIRLELSVNRYYKPVLLSLKDCRTPRRMQITHHTPAQYALKGNWPRWRVCRDASRDREIGSETRHQTPAKTEGKSRKEVRRSRKVGRIYCDAALLKKRCRRQSFAKRPAIVMRNTKDDRNRPALLVKLWLPADTFSEAIAHGKGLLVKIVSGAPWDPDSDTDYSIYYQDHLRLPPQCHDYPVNNCIQMKQCS